MDIPPVKSPALLSPVLRALVGSIPGVALGLVCYAVFEYGVGASVFVGAIGAFIGAALAQPDVSTANVLAGTAGVIAAHNAPRFMKQGILEAAFKDTTQPPDSASGELGTLPDALQGSNPAEQGAAADRPRDTRSSGL